MKEKKLKKVLYISSFLLVVSIIFLPSATSLSWGEIDTQLDYDGIYYLGEHETGEVQLTIRYEPYFIAFYPIWTEIRITECPSWLVVIPHQKVFILQPRISKSIPVEMVVKSSDVKPGTTGEVTLEIIGEILGGGPLRHIESGRVHIQVGYKPLPSIPTVDISFPSNGKEVRKTIIIKGTASDENGDGTIERVEVSIDDGPWEVATGTTIWKYVWDTRDVDDGDHQIKVRAYDGYEYSELSSIMVHVKNDESGFQVLLLAGIISVIAIATIISFMRRRNH